MKNNATTSETCRQSDNIVSYLYDEMGVSERAKFETHLADCTTCTDEFAAVADSRFSVYEWHREEFVPLATPQFSIPYESDRAKAGIFSVVAELFTFSRPAFAMAGIAFVLVVGLIAITLTRSDDQQLVANVDVPAISSGTQTEAVLPAQPAVTVPTVAPVISTFAPVKAAVRPRTTERTTRKPPANIQPDDQQRTARKAPALSEDIDIEDDSLRLSDLFDEVGG